MFSYNEIQRFSETDFVLYRFIVANADMVPLMTIRELADRVHVSTSTVLRFCAKVGCDSYSAFKTSLAGQLSRIRERPPHPDLNGLLQYFARTNTHAFEQMLEEGAERLRRADTVIFIGAGSSGALARYGARYFSNLGKFAIGLEDAYYPVLPERAGETAILALSVSGETPDVVSFVDRFRSDRCPVLSITNQPNCTLARMSDWNISCQMEPQQANGGYNATTQVPVLFLIETLARRL